MACRCQKHKIGAPPSAAPVEPTDYTTLPDEPCDICAEKHFSTALSLAEEKGYVGKNFHRIIGELNAATWHTYEHHRSTAEKLRDLRHHIQLRRGAVTTLWDIISEEFHDILKFRIGQHLCSGETFPEFKEAVWVISNCQYPQSRLVPAGPEDLLIFLNKANSLSWYTSHQHKAVFHRSPEESYGNEADKSAEHFYCFKGKGGDVPRIPDATIKEIKSSYDWNYEIEEGKVKSATTGFMVIRHLAKVLPNARINLVNFGYRVEKSSYRCPWHNWKFEAGELEKYPHIYTAEVNIYE